jgi:hypothetical protein
MSNLQPYRQIALEEKQSFSHYKKLRLLAKTNRALKAIIGKGFIKTIFNTIKNVIKYFLIGLIESICACFLITIFPLFWIIRGIDIGFYKGKSKDVLKNLLLPNLEEDGSTWRGAIIFVTKYVTITFYVLFGIPSIILFLVKSFLVK